MNECMKIFGVLQVCVGDRVRVWVRHRRLVCIEGHVAGAGNALLVATKDAMVVIRLSEVKMVEVLKHGKEKEEQL